MKNNCSKFNTIYIPNEIKVREFDGKLLLSFFLASIGYSIKIGSRSGIKREILNDYNGIYMPKSLTVSQIDFYKKLNEHNHKLIIMHSEGSILLKDIEQELISMYPKECCNYIDHFLVSGNEIKNMMIKYTPYIDKNRIHVVGDPRFDLIKPKYKSYWDYGSNELIKKYGNFILINTNFATGNSKIGNENLLSYILNNPDYSEDFKNIRIKKQTFIKEIMNSFIELIDELSTKFPNYNFIVRPHPSENKSPYINSLKSKNNIFIVHEGNVIKWIHASKAVLHYDCTTGIEALIAGKTPISFTPKINKSILAWLPVLASINVKLKSDVIELIKKLSNNKKIKNLIDKKTYKVIDDYIFNFKNYSSKNILQLFKGFKNHQSNKIFSFKNYITLIYNRFRSKVTVKMFDLKIRNHNNSISLSKFSSISKNEVYNSFKKISKINDFDFEIKVKIFGGNVAYIKKR